MTGQKEEKKEKEKEENDEKKKKLYKRWNSFSALKFKIADLLSVAML